MWRHAIVVCLFTFVASFVGPFDMTLVGLVYLFGKALLQGC
jgi:hypothetical protein